MQIFILIGILLIVAIGAIVVIKKYHFKKGTLNRAIAFVLTVAVILSNSSILTMAADLTNATGSGHSDEVYYSSSYDSGYHVDGARIYIVDKNTGKLAAGTQTYDYTNPKNGDYKIHTNKDDVYHGSGMCTKHQLTIENYTFSKVQGDYRICEIDSLFELIFSEESRSQVEDKIDRIEEWVNDDKVQGVIFENASIDGVSFTKEDWNTGNYLVGFEPIAFFRYNKTIEYVLTPTEAALFDIAEGGSDTTLGKLATSFCSMMVRRIPACSLFLEYDQCGFEAWDESTDYPNNGQIKKYLGIGFFSSIFPPIEVELSGEMSVDNENFEVKPPPEKLGMPCEINEDTLVVVDYNLSKAERKKWEDKLEGVDTIYSVDFSLKTKGKQEIEVEYSPLSYMDANLKRGASATSVAGSMTKDELFQLIDGKHVFRHFTGDLTIKPDKDKTFKYNCSLTVKFYDKSGTLSTESIELSETARYYRKKDPVEPPALSGTITADKKDVLVTASEAYKGKPCPINQDVTLTVNLKQNTKATKDWNKVLKDLKDTDKLIVAVTVKNDKGQVLKTTDGNQIVDTIKNGAMTVADFKKMIADESIYYKETLKDTIEEGVSSLPFEYSLYVSVRYTDPITKKSFVIETDDTDIASFYREKTYSESGSGSYGGGTLSALPKLDATISATPDNCKIECSNGEPCKINKSVDLTINFRQDVETVNVWNNSLANVSNIKITPTLTREWSNGKKENITFDNDSGNAPLNKESNIEPYNFFTYLNQAHKFTDTFPEAQMIDSNEEISFKYRLTLTVKFTAKDGNNVVVTLSSTGNAAREDTASFYRNDEATLTVLPKIEAKPDSCKVEPANNTAESCPINEYATITVSLKQKNAIYKMWDEILPDDEKVIITSTLTSSSGEKLLLAADEDRTSKKLLTAKKRELSKVEFLNFLKRDFNFIDPVQKITIGKNETRTFTYTFSIKVTYVSGGSTKTFQSKKVVDTATFYRDDTTISPPDVAIDTKITVFPEDSYEIVPPENQKSVPCRINKDATIQVDLKQNSKKLKDWKERLEGVDKVHINMCLIGLDSGRKLVSASGGYKAIVDKEISASDFLSLLKGSLTYTDLISQDEDAKIAPNANIEFGYRFTLTVTFIESDHFITSGETVVIDAEPAEGSANFYRETEIMPEYRSYTSKPTAYAEIKQGDIGNETYEAMAGTPTTEDLYLGVGGSEFIVDLETEYLEKQTAKRTYKSHYRGVDCEYREGDQPDASDFPSPPSGGTGAYNVDSVYSESARTLTVTWTGQTPWYGSFTGEGTWDVELAEEHWDDSAYESAYNAASAYKNSINAYIFSWTAASDQITRTYSSWGATIDGSNEHNHATWSDGTAEVPAEDAEWDDSIPPRMIRPPVIYQPEVEGTVTEGTPNNWTVTVSWTIPAYCCAGPCHDHWLPDIYDTWTQVFEYDKMSITKELVWRLENGFTEGLEEITGNPFLVASTLAGMPTVFTNICASETSEAGRFRYSLDETSDDEVTYELGQRSAHCNKQNEEWGDGILYTCTSYPHQDDYLETTASEKDKETEEYRKFMEKRNQMVSVTVISDVLILQTSSGDQSVLYYTKKSNTVKADEDFDYIHYTIKDAWDNNHNSASWWGTAHINIGGYNGKYSSPYNKYDGSGSGGIVTTIFDSDHNVTRPARPTQRLIIAKKNIDIIDTMPNDNYDTGEVKAYWRLVNNYNIFGSVISYLTKAYPKVSETNQAYVKKAPYSPEHTTVNDIVIHNPVALEGAMIFSLDKSRDQRNYSEDVSNLNNSTGTCPRVAEECEFAYLDCHYTGSTSHTAACYSETTPETINAHQHTANCVVQSKLNDACLPIVNATPLTLVRKGENDITVCSESPLTLQCGTNDPLACFSLGKQYTIPQNYKQTFNGNSLCIIGTSPTGSKIILPTGTTQYGPYLSLSAGTYCVTYTGDNLDIASYLSYYNFGTTPIESNLILQTKNQLKYIVTLTESVPNIEFICGNTVSGRSVIINELEVEEISTTAVEITYNSTVSGPFQMFYFDANRGEFASESKSVWTFVEATTADKTVIFELPAGSSLDHIRFDPPDGSTFTIKNVSLVTYGSKAMEAMEHKGERMWGMTDINSIISGNTAVATNEWAKLQPEDCPIFSCSKVNNVHVCNLCESKTYYGSNLPSQYTASVCNGNIRSINSGSSGGCLTYGPYVPQKKGKISVDVYYNASNDGNAVDVHLTGIGTITTKELPKSQNKVSFEADIPQDVSLLEIRTFYIAGGSFSVEKIVITQECTNVCKHTAALICTEPHHTGGHYSTCYCACCDDSKHAVIKSVPSLSPTAVQGDFLNPDWGFQIYFPTTGNFAQSNAYGISELSQARGKGYVDNMQTATWIAEKRVKFDFDVIYDGPTNAYNPNGNGNQNGSTNHIHNANSKIIPADTWIKIDKNYELFNFYIPAYVSQAMYLRAIFEVVAINAPDYKNDDNQETTNRFRDISFESKHGAQKTNEIDIVGRVGALVIEDTGDWRYSTTFKQPDGTWRIPNFMQNVNQSSQNYVVTSGVDIRGLPLSGYGQDIWLAAPQLRNTSKMLLLPLTPDDNIVPSFKNEPLRLGYNVYMDIQTLGNDVSEIAIAPKYYYYSKKDGSLTQLDVYELVDGNYVLINAFNNAYCSKEHRRETHRFDYVLNLSKESARRNISSEEIARTNNVSSAFGSASPWSEYVLGNADCLRFDERARTVFGGQNTYGVSQNLNNYTATAYFNNAAKRWHFTLGLPSSAKVVKTGKPATWENLNLYNNEDGYILMAMDLCAIGDITLEYTNYSTSFSVNGTTHFLPSAINNLVAVYDCNSSAEDLATIKTH